MKYPSLFIKSTVDGGTHLLPDYSNLQFGTLPSDVGVIKFQYPKGGLNFQHLTPDGVVWVGFEGTEPNDCRWMLQADSGQSQSDDGNLTEWGGKSLLDVLRRVLVAPADFAHPKPRQATNETVGHTLNVLFTEAQARGAMTGMTWAFGDTLDSAGSAWTLTHTRTIQIGATYLDLMRALRDSGFIEFEMAGTEIRIYQGPGSTVSLGTLRDVTLRADRDYSETPYQRSVENRARYGLIVGDSSAARQQTNLAADVGPFGREEVAVTASGVTKPADLDQLLSVALAGVASARLSYTRSINGGSPYTPLIDFKCGDSVMDAAIGSTPVRLRVKAINWTIDANGQRKVSIVLNDRFEERIVAISRTINAKNDLAATPTGTTFASSAQASDARLEVQSGSPDTLTMLTGDVNEDTAGFLKVGTGVSGGSPYGSVRIASPAFQSEAPAYVVVNSRTASGAKPRTDVTLQGGDLYLGVQDATGVIYAQGKIQFSENLTGDITPLASIGTAVEIGTTANAHIAMSATNVRVGVTSAGSLLVQQSNNLANYRPVLASAFTVSSTEDSKVGVIDHSYGMEQLQQLRPVQFWRPDDETPVLGVLAEQVQQVFPPVAVHHDGQLFGVDLNGLVSVVIAATQELHHRLSALEART